MELVKIVIPIYKENIDENELQSLNRCVQILGNYPIVFVAPERLKTDNYLKICKATVVRFADSYFENVQGYNRLMLSKKFYQSFSDSNYILIYQLDAYVFRDELAHWCSLNYDYIGAPVHNVRVNSFEMPIELVTLNGGLSLRKVKSHINILSRFKMIYSLSTIMKHNIASYGYVMGFLKGGYNYLFFNNTYDKLNGFDRNEDFFWAILVPRKDTTFKVPNVNESCFFSFDNEPSITMQLTNGKLPFACHAYMKYANFWKDYINLKK